MITRAPVVWHLFSSRDHEAYSAIDGTPHIARVYVDGAICDAIWDNAGIGIYCVDPDDDSEFCFDSPRFVELNERMTSAELYALGFVDA